MIRMKQSDVMKKYKTSKWYLQKLVDNGLLKKHQPIKRGRVYYDETEIFKIFGCSDNIKNLIASLKGNISNE